MIVCWYPIRHGLELANHKNEKDHFVRLMKQLRPKGKDQALLPYHQKMSDWTLWATFRNGQKNKQDVNYLIARAKHM
jgi:hypothetical protein